MNFIFLSIAFVFSGTAACSQILFNAIDEKFQLEDSSLYLVCRGTKSKIPFIAENYNISNREITHIGIGICIEDELRIFNVTDSYKKNMSALILDSLQSFISSPDIYFFGIWQCQVSKKEIRNAISILDSMYHRNIQFDTSFTIDEDDILYCSEFCVRVLRLINKKKYKVPVVEKRIDDPFTKFFLKRDIVTYFPVDFFINIPYIKEIFSMRSSR